MCLILLAPPNATSLQRYHYLNVCVMSCYSNFYIIDNFYDSMTNDLSFLTNEKKIYTYVIILKLLRIKNFLSEIGLITAALIAPVFFFF